MERDTRFSPNQADGSEGRRGITAKITTSVFGVMEGMIINRTRNKRIEWESPRKEREERELLLIFVRMRKINENETKNAEEEACLGEWKKAGNRTGNMEKKSYH